MMVEILVFHIVRSSAPICWFICSLVREVLIVAKLIKWPCREVCILVFEDCEVLECC